MINLLTLSANPTKWSNTLKKFVVFCRQIVSMCLTIMSDWRLKNTCRNLFSGNINAILKYEIYYWFLSHFRSMFYLFRNQLVCFYYQNVWKAPVKKWHFKLRCRLWKPKCCNIKSKKYVLSEENNQCNVIKFLFLSIIFHVKLKKKTYFRTKKK